MSDEQFIAELSRLEFQLPSSLPTPASAGPLAVSRDTSENRVKETTEVVRKMIRLLVRKAKLEKEPSK